MSARNLVPARRTERIVVVLRALVAALVALHVGLILDGLRSQELVALALAASILLVATTIGSLVALALANARTIVRIGWGAGMVDAVALVLVARATIQVDPNATIAWAFVLWAPFSIALRSSTLGAVSGSLLVALIALGSTFLGIAGLEPIARSWTGVGVPVLLVLVAGALTAVATLSQHRIGLHVRRQLDDERTSALQLRQADDLKNTFLAAVSHELRTPLTSILGFSITMLDRPELDEEQREAMLRTIVTEAEHLEDILVNLLDLDRLTRGKASLVPVEVDAGDLVRGSVDQVRRRSGREIVVDLQPDVRVRIDAAKVERIVENLVGNAAKYTPVDADVHVQLRSDGRGIVIRVDDGGPGISCELRETIFEPFRRGRDVGIPGTGIGLSIVDRFSRMHGGRAWVEERPGGGCRFQVFLPTSVEAATPEPDVRGPGGASAASISSAHA